jgi:PadR family transcriptional regulator, regulatory protein AphA
MPLRTISTNSFVILGQLALRPWTTYELARQMRRNFRYIWPRAESGIYAEAKTLVTRGLAEAERTFVGKRPRTTYRITPEGRRAFDEWLASDISGGLSLEFEALVRVFFGNFARHRDLQAAVDHALREANALLEVAHQVGSEYVAGSAPFQAHVHTRALIFDFLFTYAHMVHDWSERTSSYLEASRKLDAKGRREVGRKAIADALAKRPRRPSEPEPPPTATAARKKARAS